MLRRIVKQLNGRRCSHAMRILIMSFGLLGAQSGCRAVNHSIYMLSGPPPTELINIDFPPIEILEIPQHVSAVSVEPQRTLPSFLYLGDDRTYLGAFARD